MELFLVCTDIIQMWTAVECNGAVYFTVVMSYCPRPKLLVKPSYFPRAYMSSVGMAGERRRVVLRQQLQRLQRKSWKISLLGWKED